MPAIAMLGDVVRIVGGGTPTRSNSDYYDGDIPWVTPKDMKSWDIRDSQVRLTQMGVDKSATKIVPTNSVLVVVRSGVLKHTLPVGLNRRPVAINQDMKALICSDGLLPDYLARYLKGKSDVILGWVRGTTADNFSVEKLKELPIPLPSTAEQHRIVRLLDTADAARTDRKRTRDLLDELAQSIFLEMFGNLVANERKWPLVKVADFVREFQSGKNMAPAEEETGLRVLKVSAVTSGLFNPAESKPVPLGYAPPLSHFVRDGDLLFSRANTSDLVGATALVKGPPANVLLPDKLWRFVWHSSPRAIPIFVHYLFQQPEFRAKISQSATGTSGSMKNISQAKVFSIACGLPPLKMQQAFSHTVERIDVLRYSTEQHLRQLDALFASLQDRALRGEL